MEDIRWQDPYGRNAAKKKSSQGSGRMTSGSFADRFLGHPHTRDRRDSPSSRPSNGLPDGQPNGLPNGRPHMQSNIQPNIQANSQPNIQSNAQAYQGQAHPQQGMSPAFSQSYQQMPGQMGANPYYQPSPPYPYPPQSGYTGEYQPNSAPSGDAVGTGYTGYQTEYQTRWRFLDLKNRKQTGDLYKGILNSNRKNGSKVICFTSSIEGEGVTTVLANLLNYFNIQGVAKRVIAIDANVERPDLTNALGLPRNCPGLGELLSKRMDLGSVLHPVGGSIQALCAGGSLQNGRRNFEPEEFLSVVNRCREHADFVMIDCPPVLSSSNALSVAPAADLSFLVLQAVKIRRQVAEKSLAVLHSNECELGGVILNRVQQVIPGWVYRYI